MPRLVSDVINQARFMLGDETDPYRYSQPELILHVNACVGEVKRVRPDYFEGVIDDDISMVVDSDDFPLDPLLFIPAVLYVAGMAEMTDDEHVNSGRAAGVLKGFYQALNTSI